jgi:hypothetical protein
MLSYHRNNSDAYLDFFDIAVEAYNTKKTDIYRKIMTTLISSYKKNCTYGLNGRSIVLRRGENGLNFGI